MPTLVSSSQTFTKNYTLQPPKEPKRITGEFCIKTMSHGRVSGHKEMKRTGSLVP